jgi:hypothetical protein
MLPSIAYGYKTCSQKYKIQPQDMFFNNLPDAKKIWKHGGKIIKYIGYDYDESHRAKPRIDKKYEFIYPLITEKWNRNDCINAILGESFELPNKSACFFCPSSKKKEIIDLKNKYPKLYDRAVTMEKNAHLLSIKGLGRSFAWSEFVKNSEAQTELFCDAGKEDTCDCYDGD